jgi:sorting nexin-8
MPTPKRASKGELVKTLLPASDVPESYIDAFDILGASGYKVDGGKIGIAGVKKLFEGSSVDASNQDRIIKLVTGEQAHALGRSEFNVLLALIGLSEEREEASLDSVDERRKSELSLQCKLTPSAKAPGCRSSRAIVTLS